MEEISEACTPLSRDRFGRVLENVPHTYTVQTCFPLPVPSPKLLTLEKDSMCKSLKRQLQAHHDQLIIEATRNAQISQHSCEIKSFCTSSNKVD